MSDTPELLKRDTLLLSATDLFGWVRTADRLPGKAGEQSDILMWSPEWATWLKGMVTQWADGSCEWAIYNQQDDQYHEWDHPPEFWCSPSLPNTPETDSLRRLLRRGWRTFRCDGCDGCGHHYEAATRDAMSPSGDTCPECGEVNFPDKYRIDADLPCDDYGNLRDCPINVFSANNVIPKHP
jgi:hypothetical protein